VSLLPFLPYRISCHQRSCNGKKFLLNSKWCEPLFLLPVHILARILLYQYCQRPLQDVLLQFLVC